MTAEELRVEAIEEARNWLEDNRFDTKLPHMFYLYLKDVGLDPTATEAKLVRERDLQL